jgi:hypothetical protein
MTEFSKPKSPTHGQPMKAVSMQLRASDATTLANQATNLLPREQQGIIRPATGLLGTVLGIFERRERERDRERDNEQRQNEANFNKYALIQRQLAQYLQNTQSFKNPEATEIQRNVFAMSLEIAFADLSQKDQKKYETYHKRALALATNGSTSDINHIPYSEEQNKGPHNYCNTPRYPAHYRSPYPFPSHREPTIPEQYDGGHSVRTPTEQIYAQNTDSKYKGYLLKHLGQVIRDINDTNILRRNNPDKDLFTKAGALNASIYYTGLSASAREEVKTYYDDFYRNLNSFRQGHGLSQIAHIIGSTDKDGLSTSEQTFIKASETFCNKLKEVGLLGKLRRPGSYEQKNLVQERVQRVSDAFSKMSESDQSRWSSIYKEVVSIANNLGISVNERRNPSRSSFNTEPDAISQSSRENHGTGGSGSNLNESPLQGRLAQIYGSIQY